MEEGEEEERREGETWPIEKRARYVSCRRATIWPRGSTFKVVEFPATIQCHGRFTNEQLNFAVLRSCGEPP